MEEYQVVCEVKRLGFWDCATWMMQVRGASSDEDEEAEKHKDRNKNKSENGEAIIMILVLGSFTIGGMVNNDLVSCSLVDPDTTRILEAEQEILFM